MKYYIDLNESDPVKNIPYNIEEHHVLHVKAKLCLNGADGVTVIQLRLAEQLKGKFITDWLVDAYENDGYEDDANIRKFLELGGNIYYVTNWDNNGLKGKFSRYKFYYDFFKRTKYKTVYCDTDSPSRVRLLLAAKMAAVSKRIIHSHNSKCEEGISRFNYLFSRSMMPFVLTDCLACSQPAAKWMFPEILRSKVKIIRNGLEPNDWKYDPALREKMRKKLGLENTFVVGHVGRFVKQKNHERLIAVFAEIHKRNADARLMLIGDGPLENHIRGNVKTRGLEKVVIFVGTTDQVSAYMQAMDVFVFPSTFEGLGMSGVEAQASGLPSFFSDNIPQEIGIIDSAEFIPLEKDDSYWADKILKTCSKYERKDTSNMIKASGYDISDAADFIEKIIGGSKVT